MKYVIHSESERGFWNKTFGWVYGSAQATKFTETEKQRCGFFPVSKNNDAEWIVYKYDE